MPTKVKICGLKTVPALDAAIGGGADYIGLVFYPPSPRSLELSSAARLAARARGHAEIVALVVDASDAVIDEIVREVNPDVIQLHGNETPRRTEEIGARTGRRTMKAIKVATPADAESALRYLNVSDLVLFDAKPCHGRAERLPGGNGIPFDWQALAAVNGRVPFMLSGGLTPQNVVEAIRLTGAVAVDVSSGVEKRPGEKDIALIERFMAAAKGTVTA